MQSERGDVLGFVRHDKDNPHHRGYISNKELRFHTDYHELLSLACVQTASRGGESSFVSSLAIHKVLLDERPDMLAALYEGWYDGIRPYYGVDTREGAGDEYLPTFADVGGTVSFQNSLLHELAAKARGESVLAALQEAQAEVIAIAKRPGMALEFMLEPGEMAFWHNWIIMHFRKEIENEPGRERVLMRLWLHAHDPRPAPKSFTDRARLVDTFHRKGRGPVAAI